jgi:hypothetical protein
MSVLDRYPMMAPFVGSKFTSATEPSFLLVGESHYLPEDSTQHLNVDNWYSGTHETLTDIERSWIDTSGIVGGSRRNGFKNKAHSIWKNSISVLNGAGPNYEDFTRACDHIAFCNFFLRPAKHGLSLEVAQQDRLSANERLRAFLADHKPNAMVFLSALARSHWEGEGCIIPTITTPHPSSQWWNRRAKKYGGKTGKEALSEFVSTEWNKAQ